MAHPKITLILSFSLDFHKKWHSAHSKIPFAHPELPFLDKSVVQAWDWGNCCLFGAKPLTEPMLGLLLIGLLGKISMKLESKYWSGHGTAAVFNWLQNQVTRQPQFCDQPHIMICIKVKENAFVNVVCKMAVICLKLTVNPLYLV